jgi:hypothetical protein
VDFPEIDDGRMAESGVGEDAALAVEDAAAGRGFEEATEALAFGSDGVFFGKEKLVTGEGGQEREQCDAENDAEDPKTRAQVAGCAGRFGGRRGSGRRSRSGVCVIR